jgi:hypothetical protein
MFDNKTEEKKILEELMGMKTHNFGLRLFIIIKKSQMIKKF